MSREIDSIPGVSMRVMSRSRCEGQLTSRRSMSPCCVSSRSIARAPSSRCHRSWRGSRSWGCMVIRAATPSWYQLTRRVHSPASVGRVPRPPARSAAWTFPFSPFRRWRRAPARPGALRPTVAQASVHGAHGVTHVLAHLEAHLVGVAPHHALGLLPTLLQLTFALLPPNPFPSARPNPTVTGSIRVRPNMPPIIPNIIMPP